MSKVKITFNGESYNVPAGDVLLDSLLREGADIPHACRKGTCLSCMMTCLRGEVSDKAKKGLRSSYIAKRGFLACQQTTDGDFEVALPDGLAQTRVATVTEKRRLGPDVCSLRMRLADCEGELLSYQAGQFLNFRREDGLTRSYSLASVPGLDECLEIHVKRLPGGVFSGWIHDEVQPGDKLELQGPFGDGVYEPGSPDQPIMLIGTGTGLAPLIGVARDALKQGHRAQIQLYHGSRQVEGLYMMEALKALAARTAGFFYNPCVSGPLQDTDDPEAGERGKRKARTSGLRNRRAEVAAFEDFGDLQGWRVYLCGYPAMVNSAKKTAYLMGASLHEIFADPFELRDLRATAREESGPDKPDTW